VLADYSQNMAKFEGKKEAKKTPTNFDFSIINGMDN